jgi:ATP-dependent DNA ligase
MTMAWRSSKAAPARNDGRVVLCAFDLLELDGKDLRREPIERRKVLLNAIARQGVPVGRPLPP